AYVLAAKAGKILTFDGTIDLQNTSDATANVTATFLGTGGQNGPVTTTQSIAPHGTTAVQVANVSIAAGWIGAVQIPSDQPVAAVSELAGSATYGITTMFSSLNNSTYYVPRFDVGGFPGWSSVLVLQNTGSSPTTFNLTFYNPDGSVAGTLAQNVNVGRT